MDAGVLLQITGTLRKESGVKWTKMWETLLQDQEYVKVMLNQSNQCE